MPENMIILFRTPAVSAEKAKATGKKLSCVYCRNPRPPTPSGCNADKCKSIFEIFLKKMIHNKMVYSHRYSNICSTGRLTNKYHHPAVVNLLSTRCHGA